MRENRGEGVKKAQEAIIASGVSKTGRQSQKLKLQQLHGMHKKGAWVKGSQGVMRRLGPITTTTTAASP